MEGNHSPPYQELTAVGQVLLARAGAWGLLGWEGVLLGDCFWVTRSLSRERGDHAQGVAESGARPLAPD